MVNETKEMANLRQKMYDSVDQMMSKVDMKENYKEEMGALKEKILETRENVDRYIKKNPEKSVLIAAGVGAILGVIITAMIMKKKQN